MYAAIVNSNTAVMLDNDLISLLKRVAILNKNNPSWTISFFSSLDPNMDEVLKAHAAGRKFRETELAYEVENKRHSKERVALLKKRKQLQPEHFVGEVRILCLDVVKCVGYNPDTNKLRVLFSNLHSCEISIKEWKSKPIKA